MNLNRRLIPVTGVLLLFGAFMHAALETQDSTVDFEVLSEKPGHIITAGALSADTPATVSWQGNDQIVVTTVGYRRCPVLPASITTSADTLFIGLTTVPGDAGCGTSLETFTTVIRLEDPNAARNPHLVIGSRGTEPG